MTQPKPLSPIYVNGAPIQNLLDEIKNLENMEPGQKIANEERFWSTPARAQSSTINEVFEINFDNTQSINYLSFLLAHFPQECAPQWFNATNSANPVWENFTYPDSATNIINLNVFNSIPSVIDPSIISYAVHPQHYGAGHWKHFYTKVAPVNTSKIRLILKRSTNGVGPVSPQLGDVAYSLGVKDFDCGYIIEEKKDVPRLKALSGSTVEKQSFAFTKDPIGSTVQYSFREQKASGLLNGKYWKSDPQPSFDSVVSFYVDARDEYGEAQTVDRFYIEPLYTGPRLNLYYSDDEPNGVFEAEDDPLGFPLVQQRGVFEAKPGQRGIVLYSNSGLSISNQRSQLNTTSRSFSIAMNFCLSVASTSTLNQDIPLIDLGGIKISVLSDVDGYRGILFSSYENQEVIETSFAKLENIQVFFIFEKNAGPSKIIVKTDSGEKIEKFINFSGTAATPAIILGGDNTTNFPYWDLTQLCLKQSVMSDLDIEAFIKDSSAYVTKPVFAQNDKGYTNNAVLRIDPDFQTLDELSPFGIVGGTGNQFENLEWTPINRSFSLRKGFLEFNTVKAKYFKFEFLELSVQPYEIVGKPKKVVKLMPPSIEFQRNLNKELKSINKIFAQITSGHKGGAGMSIINDIASSRGFPDAIRMEFNRLFSKPASPYTATEVFYSKDAIIAQRLRESSNYFQFVQWLTHRTQQIQFQLKQKHVYTTVEFPFKHKVAFFAGLKTLKMYRVDYAVDDDTDQYVEKFIDTAHIDPTTLGSENNGWEWSSGALSLPPGDELYGVTHSTESVSFQSQRNIVGLQFATLQSPPIQLMTDPDFIQTSAFDEDGVGPNWKQIGDATVKPSNVINSFVGNALKIDRQQSVVNTWQGVKDAYSTRLDEYGAVIPATWNDIVDSYESPDRPTWDDIKDIGENRTSGGIEIIEKISSQIGQEFYVAVRIYNEKPLTVPVQIEVFYKNPTTEEKTILSSASVEVIGSNQVTEWFVPHTIGQGGLSTSYTWNDITDPEVSWNDLAAEGTWNDINHSFDAYTDNLYAQIVQNEYAKDVFYIDNVSVFVDKIKWEFSNDGGVTYYEVKGIKNNPRGIFKFPDLGQNLRWRVSSLYKDVNVLGLAIRPVYDIFPMGIPHKESVQFSGPNDAPWDQYPPILEDPWFKLWDSPIPRDWWIEQRKWSNSVPTFANNSELYQDNYLDLY
jgi:hypothetical protein